MSPHDYPVMYSLDDDAAAACATCIARRVSCACVLCPMPLYNDVSLPPRKHTGGRVRIPPGGTGVGRGGGMALRTRGTPIYILIYILRFISLS